MSSNEDNAKTRHLLTQILSVYEALMAYVVNSWTPSTSSHFVSNLVALHRVYRSIVNYAKVIRIRAYVLARDSVCVVLYHNAEPLLRRIWKNQRRKKKKKIRRKWIREMASWMSTIVTALKIQLWIIEKTRHLRRNLINRLAAMRWRPQRRKLLSSLPVQYSDYEQFVDCWAYFWCKYLYAVNGVRRQSSRSYSHD